jgi:hypothetical protein
MFDDIDRLLGRPEPPKTPDIGVQVLGWLRDGLTPEDMVMRGLVRMSLIDCVRLCRALKPDTRTQAKQLIDAEALAMTVDVIDNGDARDKLALLKGRGVLADEGERGGVTIIVGGDARVQVNVGASATFAPLDPSAEAKVIDITKE